MIDRKLNYYETFQSEIDTYLIIKESVFNSSD